MNPSQTRKLPKQTERIMLACVMFPHSFAGSPSAREQTFQANCAEAIQLVQATDGDLISVQTVKRDKIHSALFIGTGKADEWAQIIQDQAIDLLVFNHELTPSQERNLERILHCRVLDRVGLILAIFAQRAQTQEGKLQVELAQLNHLSSRLIRGYQHLQSQKGGIGLKGPGETQLETDRRLIQTKINQLSRQLDKVKKQRQTQRKARLSSASPTWAIVGYTNAGKSSLFNRLTSSDVFAQDQLFATLDPIARRLYLNQDTSIILSDTVGFIQDLPHKLVSAFSATLEETTLSDGLLHIIDISDPEWERKVQNVNDVLKEIHADHLPQIMIYNKIDRLPKSEQHPGILKNTQGKITGIRLSATTGEGLNELRQALIEIHLPNFIEP